MDMTAVDEAFCFQKLQEAYDQLKQRPKAELIRIRKTLEQWLWPEEMGEAPVKNWDELPDYRRTCMPEDIVTKMMFLKPIADALLLLGVKHSDIENI